VSTFSKQRSSIAASCLGKPAPACCIPARYSWQCTSRGRGMQQGSKQTPALPQLLLMGGQRTAVTYCSDAG
jgi:hypothetical protein